MGYEECSRYFTQKINQWSAMSPDGDLRIYINTKTKNGLVQEFRNDSEYGRAVCAFLAESATGNERDTISDILGNFLNKDAMPAELRLIVDAVLEACGYEKEDPKSEWVSLLVALFVIGGAALAIGALAKGGRGR